MLLHYCPEPTPFYNFPAPVVDLSYGVAMASTVAGTLAVTASDRKSLRVPIAIATLLALGIASYFWIDSRYPALLKKLHSGAAIKTSGVLSFDAKMPVAPTMPLATRIEHTTINWMWTNRIGMTFSLFFGAAVSTLLPLLQRRRFQSAAANTALGAITGVPLGVCANCVAPIGQSLYEGGASSATVLATMISSPMLNVVVLTMVFALFPPGVALLRLAVPLILIALVPWLVGQTKSVDVQCPVPSSGWLVPATGTLRQYGKNLLRLAATTIPFMILAALLGAIVAELIPSQAIPTHVSVVGIILVALAGAFLPVPMAFDVAAAFILMSRGVPLPYVVTLLCTLGAFSVYPMLIVGRSMSWKTSARVFAAVMGLGILAGVGTALVHGGM
jgi:uncharacterized membrane protein YraQ (UPF0718 family)